MEATFDIISFFMSSSDGSKLILVVKVLILLMTSLVLWFGSLVVRNEK
jgi:hypothetical protein